MDIIWLGHGSFRIITGDQTLLIDPWLNGNPMMEGHDAEVAIESATHILVTHGHFDHTNDIVEISKKTGAPVSSIYELAQHLTALGAIEGHAFNIGGSIMLGVVKVSMVPAAHSSSINRDGQSAYMGREVGFIIEAEGKSLYVSGDTGPMADMEWIAEYYQPSIGILSAGGYYTMDMKLAAFAAKKYFNFETVIPCHYRTFPALEQNASELATGLPGVEIIEPEVMQPITL